MRGTLATRAASTLRSVALARPAVLVFFANGQRFALMCLSLCELLSSQFFLFAVICETDAETQQPVALWRGTKCPEALPCPPSPPVPISYFDSAARRKRAAEQAAKEKADAEAVEAFVQVPILTNMQKTHTPPVAWILWRHSARHSCCGCVPGACFLTLACF